MTSTDWRPGQRVGALYKSSGQKYTAAQLAAMAGDGRAFRLADGRVLAGADVEDVRFAQAEATAALGLGTATDSSSFRSWITRRAVAVGLPPVSWAADPDRQGRGGMDKAMRLTRADVSRVDGVRSPASGRPLLLAKSLGGKGQRRGAGGVAGRVIKSVAAQQFTLQIAYPCDALDVGVAQDGFRDYAPAEVLEKAAHDFLLNPDVGLWHRDGTSGAGRVVESHIHRAGPWTVTAVDGSTQTVRNGDWLLGVRWSDEAWPLVERGLIGGVSVQGGALREPAGAGVALRKARGVVAPGLAVKAEKAARKAARKAEKAAVLAEAEHYARQAAQLSDPVEAQGAADLAKGLRGQVAGKGDLLAKAARYRRLAATMHAAADRDTYEAMAREAEQEAVGAA